MTTHFGDYRLFLANVQGKIFVFDTNKSKEKEIPLGSEIIKVNGMTALEYQIKYVNPYISTLTAEDLNTTAGYNLLSGLEGVNMISR
ncbi:Uncharacterised protein [Chryseobacterium indologenes]|nr:Uncharacterised protein [Chryseobacterium indologenes]